MRGFCFYLLLRVWGQTTKGVFLAAFVQALFFGAAHLEIIGDNPLNWIAAIDTFVLSIFLIGILHRTKSLWSAILLHAIKNTVAFVFLFISSLSFLGLGVQPPQTSWGLLISYGAETMEEFPWLLIFPGAALSLTLFSLNFLGDGLRDALDVRSSKD